MNILWHMPTLRRDNCGLSVRALHLARHLETCGHQVAFIVDSDKTDIAEETVRGMPLERMPARGRRPPHWSLQALGRRRAAADAARAAGIGHDLVISCQPEFVSAFASLPHRPPLLYVCGGTTLLHDQADRARQIDKWAGSAVPRLRRLPFALDRWLKHRNEAAAFRAADAIVFDSHHTRKLVRACYGIGPEKCHTIHGGVDDGEFRPPDDSTRRAARERLGIPDEDIVIVWTGRFSPEKNVALLLQALRRCEHTPTRALLIGDGPLMSRLVELRRQLGLERRAHFAGRQRDVRPFLYAADIFAFPSLGESFGGALAEAMACGLPCVALRPDGRTVSNACEEILSPGRSGLLVDSPEPAALARALDRLAQDPALRAELGAAAHRRAASRFTWSAGGARLNELVLEMLGQACEPVVQDQQAGEITRPTFAVDGVL